LIETTPMPSPPLKTCRAPVVTGEGSPPYSQVERRPWRRYEFYAVPPRTKLYEEKAISRAL